MTHCYTSKGNRRYRYYVCSTTQKRGWRCCPTKSVPAAEIESFVVDRIRAIGADPGLTSAVWAESRRQQDSAAAALPEGTIPRISRLMALAIHFDQLLACGAVESHAELAWRHRVTRARMSQIMALNRLAPEIQETLLFLPRTVSGRAPVTERDLRAVAAEVDWGRPRQMLGKASGMA